MPDLAPIPIDFHAISPEIVLVLAACAVLMADLFLPREAKWLAMPLAAAGIVGTLAAVVSLIGRESVTLAGSYEIDTFALVFKALFCVIGLVVLGISFNHFRAIGFQGEYYFLLMSSLLGGIMMASSRDLIAIFIAIELISIPAIVMVALRKTDLKSNESALKFFIFSVMSSAVMLFGMSLVYGVTGSTNLAEIRAALAGVDEPLVMMAVFFVVGGFAFKVSAVPFHFWAPDTYEGAPPPVAAFLSTASKIGGFVGLLILMFRAFPEVAGSWRPVFAVLAVLTMSVGNLIALRQRHIIRLLAYSGIAQSGYVLVCFALIDPAQPEINSRALAAAIVYLVIYGLMDAGAFGAAIAFRERGGSYFIDDYAGLWARSPALALMMAGFMVSLAGAPPMAGVWAKLFVFQVTIEAQVYWLAVVMGVNAVIAAWYYLFVVKKMFLEAPEEPSTFEASPILRAATGIATLALLVLFVYPPLITEAAERSAALAPFN